MEDNNNQNKKKCFLPGGRVYCDENCQAYNNDTCAFVNLVKKIEGILYRK